MDIPTRHPEREGTTRQMNEASERRNAERVGPPGPEPPEAQAGPTRRPAADAADDPEGDAGTGHYVSREKQPPAEQAAQRHADESIPQSQEADPPEEGASARPER